MFRMTFLAQCLADADVRLLSYIRCTFRQKGNTALMTASEKGNVVLAELLMAAKADVQAQNQVRAGLNTWFPE